MKKITLTTLFAILFLNINFAQVEVAFITGIHSSNTTSESGLTDMTTLQPIQKLSAALLVEKFLDSKISAKTGVIYRKKGFKIEETMGVDVLGMSLPVGAMVSTELNYLDIPLELKYNFTGNPKIQPYISAGPVLSYALDGEIKTKARAAIFDINVNTTPLVLSSNDYNRVQFLGQINTGIKVPYGSGHWIAEAGYTSSFTNLVSEDFLVAAGGKHKGWSLNVGYGLRF